MSAPSVLVVDDHADTIELLTLCFGEAGFAVHSAATVSAAIDGLEGGLVPTLIVTDLIMPEVTGWDLLKYLREDPVLRRIPVIVITAADPTNARAICDALVQKPLDPERLVGTARQLVAAQGKSS